MQHWNKPRKPSPVIFLSGFGEAIRESLGYLFFIAISYFFKKENPDASVSRTEFLSWGFGGFLVLVVVFKFPKIFAWFFTRYWVENNKIILTSGILVKSRVELAFNKIQTIQSDQNLLHRITNTCRFTIDSAGSEKPEFVIDAMRLEDARDLQQWISTKQQAEGVPAALAPEQETVSATALLLTLSPMDYIKLCISENHFKSLLILIVFAIGKAQDLSEKLGLDSFGFIQKQTADWVVSLAAISTLVILALVVSILFSTVQVLIKFYNYRILRRNETFEISWGLLSRQRKSMPFAKMEFLSWSANWLRGRWSIWVLRIHSLAESKRVEKLHLQMPVVSKAMLNQIVGHYIPELPASTGQAETVIQKAYFYRFLFILSMVFIPVLFVLTYQFSWQGLWSILFFGYLLLTRYYAYRNYKIWTTEEAIQVEKGVWGRENLVVYFDKVISVNVKTTPYQRRNGYVTLQLVLPGEEIELPYMHQHTGAYWADLILKKMEE
jgi:putative membrane protein